MKKYQLHYGSENQGSFDAKEFDEEVISKGSGTAVMLVIFSIAVVTFVVFAVVGLQG